MTDRFLKWKPSKPEELTDQMLDGLTDEEKDAARATVDALGKPLIRFVGDARVSSRHAFLFSHFHEKGRP